MTRSAVLVFESFLRCGTFLTIQVRTVGVSSRSRPSFPSFSVFVLFLAHVSYGLAEIPCTKNVGMQIHDE